MASAQQPDDDVTAQIAHLIAFVRASPCGFIRNGTRHDGPQAAEHIREKYEYFRRRIHSTEDFIDLAATKSALSGRPYQVECPGQSVVSAADWLRAELQRHRAR